MGIYTIGELANTPHEILKSHFGKWGDILYNFSNGYDASPVKEYTDATEVKSIGNSTTAPKDLTTNQDVNIVMSVLCDSVARRMRENGVKGRTVSISVRDCELFSFTRQRKLEEYTNITSEITKAAMRLFIETYNWPHSVRSIGVSMSDLVGEDVSYQLNFFDDPNKKSRLQNLDDTVDRLKDRFGTFAVRPASALFDTQLSGFDPIKDHTIHPVGYF